MLRRSPFSPAALLLVLLLVTTGCASFRGDSHDPRRDGGYSSTEWAQLRFTVQLTKSPADRLRAIGSVTNTAYRARQASVPWCLAWIKLYTPGGHLAWDRDDRDGCAAFDRDLTMGPGETETRRTHVKAEEVLPEGVDRATYVVRAFLPPLRRPGYPPRVAREFTVGTVELARSDSTLAAGG